jgi:hypothetical protein
VKSVQSNSGFRKFKEEHYCEVSDCLTDPGQTNCHKTQPCINATPKMIGYFRAFSSMQERGNKEIGAKHLWHQLFHPDHTRHYYMCLSQTDTV